MHPKVLPADVCSRRVSRDVIRSRSGAVAACPDAQGRGARGDHFGCGWRAVSNQVAVNTCRGEQVLVGEFPPAVTRGMGRTRPT